MKFTSRLVVFITLILLFTASSFAQSSSASLRGEITDPTGAVIPGATVSAKSSSGQTVTVKTNRSGAYELRGLAPGKYLITLNAKGFAEATQDVEITAGKDQKLDLVRMFLRGVPSGQAPFFAPEAGAACATGNRR